MSRASFGVVATMTTLASVSLVSPVAFAQKTSQDAQEERGPYIHLLGTAALGTGLRFNNPYRLEKTLGSTAESVSLSARYLDLGLGVLSQYAGRFQHGVHLHWSHSLSGIPQSVVTPSYMALYRPSASYWAYARGGVPFVLSPDKNMGGEIALGGAWFALSGIGLTAEIGGDGFYGAATREVSATFIPILYAQAGLVFDLEILR